MLNDPKKVNAQGSSLTDGSFSQAVDFAIKYEKNDPLTNIKMFTNWLTAGGPPKPIEAGAIFKEAQDMAPVEQKAAAGAGINGLFGMGSLIGDLTPVQPLKGLNLSPLQPGVPYAAPAIPKVGK